MENYLLLLPILISFFVVIFAMPFWIRKAKEMGLVWEDMNKVSDKRMSGSGGIVPLMGFVVGLLFFIAYRTFYLGSSDFLIETLAALSCILLLGGIGFVDDLFGWRKGGLSRRSRLGLVLLSAIPLMAINAGRSMVGVPFLGEIELGLIYPLFLIPLGIVGASTTFNFLAGFNGLEAGQGIIILSASALVAFLTGSSWLAIIAMCMIFALLGFMFFNFYPAKVFPGDSLTLSVGGLIAIMSILGNFEKVALFFFSPYVVETVLKSRGRLVKYSFGKPAEDGTLSMKYSRIYGLTHLLIFLMGRMGMKPTEKKVVYGIWIFQILIILLGFLIFREGIF
jgi:UDP-N-acetylglucosamine--dolichyl-phosphate N-acetylglucosaminephosphotransferase